MKSLLSLFICITLTKIATAQSIGIGTNSPNPNAKLDIVDTTKGILIPRLDSSHRKQITNTLGMLVFDADYKTFWYNDGSRWISMGSNQNVGQGVNSGYFFSQPIDADGNVYPVTQIGNQLWTAANLRTTHFMNGDSIPFITDSNSWTNTILPAVCYYDNDSANDKAFGKLYNFYAIKDLRSVCPYGWHIPSDSEWTVLYNSINGHGNLLKIAGTKYWQTLPATTASYGNNQSGFSAFPGGKRRRPYSSSDPVSFISKYYEALFWSTKSELSSLPPSTLYGMCWFISSNQNALYSNWIQAESGLSCRCIQD